MILSAVLCWISCPPLLANPGIDVGARLDVDLARYEDDVTPLESGIDLRRLRLEMGGKLTEKLAFYALADFSDGTYSAQASWLRYRINAENDFYAGRIEVPFSLQHVTNSQFNLFMERALPAALTPHYGTGLVLMHKGRQWSWRLGLFGDDELNFNGSTESGTMLAFRAGRRLRLGASRVWLGASAMVQDTTEPDRFQTRPESNVTSQKLVGTGSMPDVGNTRRTGLEAVWKAGQWSLQWEWIHYAADPHGADDVALDGGYVEASRMFNGRRRFNFRRGEWMSPETGDKGSWELAGRVSWIDLRSGAVTGGAETNYSFGLNYYFNSINRVMFNWIKADAHPNRRGVNESPSLLQLRLQISF